MNEAPYVATPLWLRILRSSPVRLILLGGALFFIMGTSNGLMLAAAGSPLGPIAWAACMATVALAVYIAFVRVAEGRPVSELAVPGMGRQLGLGLLIGAGLYTACVLILIALGLYRVEGLNPWWFMWPAAAMALSSGVIEELLFRGVIFRIVEEALGTWVSLIVSSLVFGFIHLANPAATLTGALFISIEAGVLLAAAYMATRRLWLSIGFHVGWNYTQSGIFSGIVSGADSAPGLIKSTISGPPILTGGSFGIEASLIAFVLCTLTGVALLVAAVRCGHVKPGPWSKR